MKQDTGLFLIRLGLGIVFVIAGLGKIMDVGAFAPAVWNSMVLAWLVSLGEFFGGLSLITGFLMRYATWGLTLIMLGALVLVGIPGIDMAKPESIMGLLFIFSILTTLIGLAFTGTGSWRIGRSA